MAYVVTQPCCNDATCVTVCPVNCIHPTPDEPEFATAEILYIDPDGCIDCGACVGSCPVDAIVFDFDLTEETERYHEINARYYADPAHREYSPEPYEPKKPTIEVSESEPLRVAIVGSGPAGCYAAEELLTRRGIKAEVNLFERLPTPWGLVRFGVAPDHQETKSVATTFARTAGRTGLEFHLNVEVGKHVTHEELLAHHHAVIYAVGAADDRRLGVRGEDLPGCHPATEFVGWYNGHPDFAGQSFELSGRRAVIIGNGNVALDLARILATEADQLERTDIAEHALGALAHSAIDEIVVLGRRGPAQASFTIPELLGLASTPGLDVVVDPADARLDPLSTAMLHSDPHSMNGLKADVVAEIAVREPSGASKQITLRFLTSPVEILGDTRVQGVRVVRNELVATEGGLLQTKATGETEDIECGLLLKSVGFQGTPLPGLPFDEFRGTLPHDRGRVADGVYAAGWIKRGPSGVIGTNKKCAAETVETLLADFAAGRLAKLKHDNTALRALIRSRQPDALDYGGWQAIDLHERTQARAQHRPRTKLTDVPAMVRVARGTVSSGADGG